MSSSGASVYLYLQRCGEASLAPELGWLSDTEHRRAERIRHPRARNEFITGRRLARLAVSRLLGVAPQRIRFRLGELGQPRLASPEADPECHFSISHSHGLVLCATSLGRRVGTDVEPLSRASKLGALTHRILTESEHQEHQRQPEQGRDEWLLRRWVDKEAYSKALGLGLQLVFSCVRIEDGEQGLAHFDSAQHSGHPSPVRRWYPRLEAGYMISVVCELGRGGGEKLSIVDLGECR